MSTSFQAWESLEILCFPHYQEFCLIFLCLFYHQSLRPSWKITLNHYQCVNNEDSGMLTVFRVKMGNTVFAEVHFDVDSIKT